MAGRRRIFFGMGLIIAGTFISACESPASKSYDYSTWNSYAGTKDGNRYSSNSEINVDNVKNLQVAWIYSTKDKDTANRSQIQFNPIIVDDVFYGASPRLKLFALDAATGENKWVFDPNEEGSAGKINYGISRGVTYWEDENGDNKRILYGVNSRLYAIDISDGTPIADFGENGSIDLRKSLDREQTEKKAFFAKTPGVIYKDLLIMGMSVSEKNGALPGHIRAFDVRTGERRWIFHTIPHPGEYGYDTWEDKDAWRKFGGANSWAGMALDEERGMVYIPTGSAAPDFYGGFRKGANLFANSLVALDAATGEYKWHYQIIHHDLWDRDLPANPNLVTLNKDGKEIDAIAQITKHGYTFLFDRTNGEPIFPIEERPVPQEALPGEKPWPTQPIPTKPEPFARQKFAPEDVNDIFPETHKELMAEYNKIKHGKPFTPPSKEGGWIFPGFDGGGEWGGAAVDVESQILYVNSSELPWSQVMVDIKRKEKNDNSIAGKGSVIYNRNCLSCHGENLQGSGASYPSLVNLDNKYNEQQVREFINTGGNRMPSFDHLPEKEKDVLIAFLLNMEESNPTAKSARHAFSDAGEVKAENVSYEPLLPDEVPYTMTGYNRFLDKNGYPGIKPPWGTLNAVDLNSGELLWKVPLGEYPKLTERGIPKTGTENYGGPVVTKGGLVFIAATKDEMIRAFDKNTGEELWKAKLPAAGYATPATYEVDGKQYLVIACGGGKIGSKSGDTYVAFALPDLPE